MLGFEPTGHYWKPFIKYLSSRGVEAFFIKTTAVEAMRELTDSTHSKNHRPEAATLAHPTREKALKSPPQHGLWRELRELTRDRQRLSECNNAFLSRLKVIIETLFPELIALFSGSNSVALWKLLVEVSSQRISSRKERAGFC